MAGADAISSQLPSPFSKFLFNDIFLIEWAVYIKRFSLVDCVAVKLYKNAYLVEILS